MRPIKFRAWDNNIEIMRDPDWCNELRLGLLTSDPTLELMQFTGLLDKNGKEIYESDYLWDGREKWRVYEAYGQWLAMNDEGSRDSKTVWELSHQSSVSGNQYEGERR